MLQILAGGLVGSLYRQDEEKCDYGSLIIAIDPEKLGSKTFMIEQIKELERVYKKEGGKDILLPGERGGKLTRQALKSGKVQISNDMLDKIKQLLEK
jgi:LDH2 family malate/lactate/ureidoglycolate dehydrogenase